MNLQSIWRKAAVTQDAQKATEDICGNKKARLSNGRPDYVQHSMNCTAAPNAKGSSEAFVAVKAHLADEWRKKFGQGTDSYLPTPAGIQRGANYGDVR